ncbi:phage tail spike protein [Enterococcus sp. AZ103]|uniref:phage tail spike protein n=1 Tax=Enterococcus sp. AZ103 TaxID=2774628 RepID=UPI003F1F5A43
MSTLILFDKTNNNWSSLGLGPLTDAKNPIVDRERNGIYTLSFQYPVFSPLFKELKIGRWIVADAGPTKRAKSQKFEIETITKPIDGIVTVYCEHYRYQLLRTAFKVMPVVKDVPAQTALNQLRLSMLPQGDFSFYSDVTTKSTLDLSDPSKFKNAQEILGGVQGSVLDNFGGEYVFDNNQVRLLASAGSDTNVVIAYGKNLTDITQEENIANTYTSVYGWYKEKETERIVILPESIIDSDYVGNYTQSRVLMVDFSEDEPSSVETLRSLVKAYIRNNNVGIPKVSIKTSFEDLASSVLADELKTIETLDLCDTVTIAFNELEINTTAKIIKTSWNVALDKYDSIELGEAQTDFGKVMADSEKNTNQIINKVNWLENAQKEASDILKNPGVGHVVIYPSLADPQEILIMDTTNVNTAKNVWRWNAGGLGFSSTGYNGTYGLAMTNNGAIVADRMTTGILRAINIIGVAITGSTITGSTITSESGNDRITMSGASISTYFGNILRSKMTPTSFFVNDSNGVEMMNLSSRGLSINKKNTTNQLGYLGRGTDNETGREELAFNVDYGNIGVMAVQNTSMGLYFRRLAVSSAGVHAGNIIMGGNYVGGNREIKDAILKDAGATGKFEVFNNVSLNFYSNLNMNGWSILNNSDIRLKENIEKTDIDGISETKKLDFYEFYRKQHYQFKDDKKQPSRKRELGLIAQYSPFLSVEDSEDHYQSIDTNKQIMLNSLTNKQLIEIVEKQEERLRIIEQALNMSEEVENG